jgi:uncharacterized membrane protein
MSFPPAVPPALEGAVPPASDALGGETAPLAHASPAAALPALQLPALARIAVLLVLEGMSVGLFLWAMQAGLRISPYATSNVLTPRGRTYLIADMLGLALAALLGAGALLVATRGRRLAWLQRLAHRMAPLALLGVLPFLMRWRLWQDGRELAFLVLAGAFALGTRAAVAASLGAGPVLGGWVGAALAAGRARGATALARSARWAPVTLVWAGVLWYAIFFAYATVANHHNLRTASLDLGLEDNLIWNILHGGAFLKTSPAFGPVGSHFGFHATFFAYVIAGFYFFAQRAETLLVFQASMIALAAVPLYLFAKRHLGAWVAALIALCYLLYPPLHGSNLYDFHYLPLGPVLLWLTLWLIESRHDRWAVLAVLLTLSVREDIAVGLVIVGGYLILAGKRPRAGLLVAAVAGSYFVLLKMVLMPRALHGASSFIHQWAGLLPAGENSFGAVMKTVIGNPVFTLHSLLERDKLIYILQIAVPLCFIPWFSEMGILCSLPGFLFTLLATQYPPLIQISFQYTAHWTAYLFIALVWNLKRMSDPAHGGNLMRRRTWMAALLAGMLLTSHQFGALLQQNTARGGFGPYVFRTTDSDRARYATLLEVIGKIPPRARIVSSENLVPHVTQRPNSYTLRMGLFDAEYILTMIPVRGDEASYVRTALQDGSFGVVTIKEPFMLARRGHETSQNAAVLGRF